MVDAQEPEPHEPELHRQMVVINGGQTDLISRAPFIATPKTRI
jgi:hypothetical protein